MRWRNRTWVGGHHVAHNHNQRLYNLLIDPKGIEIIRKAAKEE